MEWDGIGGKMGADHAEPGRQARVRRRVRLPGAMVEGEHRKREPDGIGSWPW